MDYSDKIKRINDRYNPDKDFLIEKSLMASDFGISGDVSKYVLRAMREVDKDYTQKTFDAGNAAKNQLSSLPNVSFEYQGSVMTDTHIKGASDIDLLVICDKFYGSEIDKVRTELQKSGSYPYQEWYRLKQFENNFETYKGNSVKDLKELRLRLESILSSAYLVCDTTKPKSIKITNSHYHRDVDVVTSSIFYPFDYVRYGSPQEYRGIKIYYKEKGYAVGPDYPFLSIKRINVRSAETNGRLKRMIRFLKNVRTDSDKMIDLKSFDINAICYSIPPEKYKEMEYRQIVHLLWETMYHLWKNNEVDNLKSVVGDEYVFKNNAEKVTALKQLEDEVWHIYQDLNV